MFKRPIIPLLAIMLGACSVGPDFKASVFSGLPGWKRQPAVASAPLPGDWWTLYGDKALNDLVSKALRDNPSLEASQARVKTSRALVGVDRARLFPVLDLSASAMTQRYSEDAVGAQLPPGLTIPLESARYQGGLDLSYELDLWGGNRRRVEAAVSEAQAAEALHRAQRLGLAAEVVRQYILMRGLEAQAQLLKQVVASREATVRIEKEQRDAGLLDTVQTSQSASDLELARNDLALVDRQLGAVGHALAVLCGQAPSEFKLPASRDALDLPKLRAGTTAEVLARRPDLRAAGERLHAANARIGVAESAFYPSFSLFGSGGYEAINPARFLDWQNRVFSLGAGAVLPVFRGGANRAAWQASVAARDEALADYRNTLLVALREVEDALLDIQSLGRSQAAIEAALQQQRKAQGVIRERQSKGLASQLELAASERLVLALELQLVQTRSQQLVSAAMLCKALGGGW